MEKFQKQQFVEKLNEVINSKNNKLRKKDVETLVELREALKSEDRSFFTEAKRIWIIKVLFDFFTEP